MSKGLQESTKKNISRILFVLKNKPDLHLRAICKVLELNPFTVSTIIDRYLLPFVEINYHKHFNTEIKIINLKQNMEHITLDDVLNLWKAMK